MSSAEMGVIFLMVEVLLLLPTANSVNKVLSSTVQAIDIDYIHVCIHVHVKVHKLSDKGDN